MCVCVFVSCVFISVRICVSMVRGQHHEALGLHYVMFLPTLRSQGDAEQRKKWLPLAESFKALGTYAQTEMGHG